MPTKKLLHALLGLSLFVGVTAVLAAGLIVLRLGGEIFGDLGRINAMKDDSMPLTSEVFDRSGAKIGEFASERRYFIRLKELPPHVIQAFLSAEDKDFYHHFGVSPVAIARSALANLRGHALRQGASTITQQLARIYFLDQRKTWERKAKEALLAVAIEQKLTKDEILELYLNKIFLGNRSFGVEAASRNYFRKHAADLDVGEAALLAGLPKSPTAYAPNRHPKAANRRQLFVLKRMEADGALAKGDAVAWAKRVVHVAAGPEDFFRTAPYFLDAAYRELIRKFELEHLPQEGLKIYTTLDAKLQQVSAAQLRATLTEARRRAVTRGKSKAEIEGALVSIDPKSGAVLAMQGGSSFHKSQFNRSEATRRRMSGLFLPVYVSLALERGFSLLSRVGDDPIGGRHLTPDSGAVTLYDALVKGLTLEAAPLYTALGNGSVLDYAEKLGLHVGREDLSVAFGYGEATPEQMAVLYSAFVNGGRLVAPYLIERIVDADGQTVYKARHDKLPQGPLTPAAAYMVTQALTDAVQTGHAAAAAGVSPAAFGAAAASDDLHDAWFAGGLPSVVSAVWIGAENGQARLAASETDAAALPAKAWAAMLKAAPERYVHGVKAAPPPVGIAFVRRPGSEEGSRRSLPVLSDSAAHGSMRTPRGDATRSTLSGAPASRPKF